MRPRRVSTSFLAALLALIWGFSSFQISRAATFIVTNADDDGAGSLRQAIADANASIGVLDTIQFSIDTGTQTIFLLSALNITDPVIIDGTTQPGFTGSPLIILDGSSAVPGANGIIISGGGSTISGLALGRFEGAGIQIAGSGSIITNNYIGTDGVNPLPNGIGIEILSSGNRVGGMVGGSGNLITNNVGPGIIINDGGVPGAAVNNAILGNTIFDNGGLGIDLFPAGVTLNDAGDADGGPNNLQNFPVITAATPGSVTGTLASAPDTTYRVEFYRNAACDPSGYGEGENYLDYLDVTTDAAGDASFNISGLTLIAGDFLTVTATAPNNDTSEFSECVEVVDAPIYLSAPLPDPDPGSLLTIFTTEGVPASAVIQVRNPGTATLNITQVNLDNLTDFSLLSAASFNVPAGGGPITIEIQCDADTGPGLFTTGVTVEHNAAGSPATYTVDCDVASVPTPVYVSAPAPGEVIDLGTTAFGSSVTGNLYTTNLGTANLTVSEPAAGFFSGTNAADFSLVAGTAPPFTLGPDDDWTVVIRCTPLAAGDRTAILTFDTTDPVRPSVSYTLNCRALLLLSPTVLPDGAVGVLYPDQTITASGGSGSYTFDLFSGSLPPGLTLSPGGLLSGTPTLAGTFPFTVRAADDADNTITGTQNYTIIITDAVPGYDSSPAPTATINVGTSTVGTPVTTTLTISETGNAPLDVGLFGGSLATAITGANAADFTITAPAFPFTIADGGANQPITIQCIPGGEGLRSATLTLTSNDPAWPTIAYPLECTGTAVLTPGYDSTPVPGSTINLTTTQGSPVSTNIAVSNPGSAPLNVTS
ncbi:MAG: right-handed parallel beta-helix repeat-containing protein, partial [Chloroflexi bacterium]|nr:right-handed parallel beta-helix repeat-containing protein [Chloroflexota bacterium]